MVRGYARLARMLLIEQKTPVFGNLLRFSSGSLSKHQEFPPEIFRFFKCVNIMNFPEKRITFQKVFITIQISDAGFKKRDWSIRVFIRWHQVESVNVRSNCRSRFWKYHEYFICITRSRTFKLTGIRAVNRLVTPHLLPHIVILSSRTPTIFQKDTSLASLPEQLENVNEFIFVHWKITNLNENESCLSVIELSTVISHLSDKK